MQRRTLASGNHSTRTVLKMGEEELVPQEAGVIVGAPDAEAVAMERDLVEATDNGWVEGDPLDQPDNPEEVRTDG
jgi:hypothetical protein